MKLNPSAVAYGNSLVKAGKVNIKSPWSFSAEDGNAVLGDPPDWKKYSRSFLGIDPDADAKTKTAYHYPFAKGGEIYRSGLIAIRSRAAAQGETDIFDQAGKWIETIDKTAGEKAEYGVDFWQWYYGTDQFLPKASGAKILPIELSDGAHTVPLLFKSFNSQILNTAVDGNENIVKLRVTVAKRDRQSDIIDPLGVDVSLWLKPNSASPTGKSGPITWMHDLDSPAIARGLSWEPTAQYADIVQEYHTFSEFARECRDMRKAGFLNESSVNVVPIQWQDVQDASIHNDNVPVNPKNGDWVRTYTKTSLKEIADCNVGVNPYTETLERAVRKAVGSGVTRADGAVATWLTEVTRKLPIQIIGKPIKEKSTMAEDLQKSGASMSAKNKAHSEKADEHMEACKALHKAVGDAHEALLDKAMNIHDALRKGEEPDADDLDHSDVAEALHKALTEALPHAKSAHTDEALDKEIPEAPEDKGEKAVRGDKATRVLVREMRSGFATLAKSLQNGTAKKVAPKVFEIK